MEFILNRIIAQSRVSGTSNTTLYTKSTNQIVNVSHLILCNTTASDVTYRVFVDFDGNTYDQSTALYYDVTLRANTTEFLDIDLALEAMNATIGVQTSSSQAITFTLIGQIKEF